MRNVHIVIPDLFLPQQLATYASGDLCLPALEKMLARAQVSTLRLDSLEAWLCDTFSVEAIAPLTLQADGVPPGDAYWLRADPVGISMQRDQMVLQGNIELSEAEATQLCASLNTHFAEDGLCFVAPHPQRWYLQLAHQPDIKTYPLFHVVGADMYTHLPFGADALHWHSVLNEIQMLFYEHAVNQARASSGKPAINAVWLWGGGKYQDAVMKPFSITAGDSDLAFAFAQAAGIPCAPGIAAIPAASWADDGDMLIVYESLRVALQKADIGHWRAALQLFETTYAEPLLSKLVAGHIEKITLDMPGENAGRRFVLTRAALRKFWRSPKPLLHYALA
jgi:hypothetical protein